MYNEQMESLISAALADGVLTEKEKQILFKKAESMGIDLDEFEMVLDARLVEEKKKEAREAAQYELEMEKAKSAQRSAPNSNKFGDVRKCPSCGAMIESLKAKCPQCGFEFSNIDGNSTTQILLAKLDAIDAERAKNESNQSVLGGIVRGIGRVYAGGLGLDRATNRKCQIIQTYPIPNTKDDLIEMLTLAHSWAHRSIYDTHSTEDRNMVKAWKAKEKQLLAKADLVLKNDADYLALKESIKPKKKWGLF